MADPAIELDGRGEVKMLKVPDPEIKEILIPVQDDDTLEEPSSLNIIEELTEEELEEEFNKLSASIRLGTINGYNSMRPTRGPMVLQELHPK